MPGVEQQEAAGAVGVLGAARLEAGLAERGRLLIAGAAGNRDRPAEPLARQSRRSTSLDGRTSGSMARGMSRISQQLVVPIERVDVEDQRAAGVAVVGDVPLAAGQSPDEPGVDGAEEDFAALRPARAVRSSVSSRCLILVPEK